jgi:hypothetical protein
LDHVHELNDDGQADGHFGPEPLNASKCDVASSTASKKVRSSREEEVGVGDEVSRFEEMAYVREVLNDSGGAKRETGGFHTVVCKGDDNQLANSSPVAMSRKISHACSVRREELL